MNIPVLFIQGGGDGGYEADAALVTALQKTLGDKYSIMYPRIHSDVSAPDFGWLQQIDKLISENKENFILMGHSFGASMLLKFLSEHPVKKKIKGIFLMSTPFWSGKEDWKKALILKEDFAEHLPKNIPLYFYHCRDDEEVPFSHFINYKQIINQGIFREIKSGGHQFTQNLMLIAGDIKGL